MTHKVHAEGKTSEIISISANVDTISSVEAIRALKQYAIKKYRLKKGELNSGVSARVRREPDGESVEATISFATGHEFNAYFEVEESG